MSIRLAVYFLFGALGITAAKRKLSKERSKKRDAELLRAICDTFVSPLSDAERSQFVATYSSILPSSVRKDRWLEYADFKADDAAIEYMQRVLAQLPWDIALQIKIIMFLLNTSIGTFLLCGKMSSFNSLSVQDREKVFQRWSVSKLPQIRGLFKAFKTLSLVASYCCLSNGVNKSWKLVGYPGKDPRTADPKFYSQPSFKPVFLDLQQVDLHCDAVVIGSGCGGSVVGSFCYSTSSTNSHA